MFKKLAALTTLILASSAAFAAQPNSFYAGADVGRTKIDDIDRDTSVGGFVGYNFHQNFAVEGGYRRLADMDYRVSGVNANVRADQLALSVIGSLPVGESFSVFGRLGVNRLEVKGSAGGFSATESETKALYGAGVSYAFSPVLSVRVEVQKPASDATNVSAGIAFQF